MTRPAATNGRIATGVVELDAILGGGFPEHSVNIVMGQPGTGKTIFAEQLLFHNARNGRPALFLTTLSEPLAKVIKYLQSFTFFDADVLNRDVIYDDIGADLAEHGVEAVVEHVQEAIRQLGPRIIVIDSFKAIHDLAGSPPEMRRLIARLAGVVSAFDTTTFLVGEYSEDQIPQFPEFAVADGILELARLGTQKRDERYLRVRKLRGSGYSEGVHAFTITASGLHVFPRLVTPSTPPPYAVSRERATTGVDGLDALLDGGFWRGSTVLVAGSAGTGKTTVGIAFAVDGVERGEPSLLVNFQENPTQQVRALEVFGDVAKLQASGLELLYASPVELQIDSVVVEIFRIVNARGIRRVVIDSLGDLLLASADAERFHDYLYSLAQQFAARGVTALMTLEAQGETPSHDPIRISSMSDVLIELAMPGEGTPTGRMLRVVKARGTAHDLGRHVFAIDGGHPRILPTPW